MKFFGQTAFGIVLGLAGAGLYGLFATSPIYATVLSTVLGVYIVAKIVEVLE